MSGQSGPESKRGRCIGCDVRYASPDELLSEKQASTEYRAPYTPMTVINVLLLVIRLLLKHFPVPLFWC